MAENVVNGQDLEKIRTFAIRYNLVTKNYGETFFQKKLIEADLVELEKEMANVEAERVSLMADIKEKYGEGQIDMNTGVFTPSVSST